MADMSSQGGNQAVKGDLEQPTKPSGPDPSSFDLKYPEIPLHLSLESLLAHSSSSNSSLTKITMPPPESDQRSLDSSWTSIGGYESPAEDDLQSESEHTDVESLLDVHRADDVHSVTDGFTTDDAESTDDEDLRDTLTEEVDRGNILGPYIRHEEPSREPSPTVHKTPNLQQHDVKETRQGHLSKYTISRQLTEAEVQSLPLHRRDISDSSDYISVLRMPVSDDGFDLENHNHFKVLLLGRQTEDARRDILRKVADTLVSRVSTPSSSVPSSVVSFHLVQNVFGPGAEPDCAELVTIDKMLEFECYDTVVSSKSPRERSQIVLKNSGTGAEIVSERRNNKFVVGNPRWSAPDLAIVCVHLDDKGIMEADSHTMLAFAERHGIPRIVIRMDQGWEGYYQGALMTSDLLHETIESRHKEPHDKVFPSFPINMDGFLDLDCSQLNGHIAHAVSTAEQKSAYAKKDQAFEDEEKSRDIFDFLSLFNSSILKYASMLLCIVGVYAFVGLGLLPALSAIHYEQASGVMSPGAVHIVNTTGQLLAAASATSCLSVQASQALHQFVDVNSAKFAPLPFDDMVHFQVSIASDNQLLVKVPKVATGRKNRSELNVELRRKDHTVPAAVKELFEGVFGVQLPAHDAYGDIVVNLTMSQPQLNEILTVSFGDRYNFEVRHLRELWSMLYGHAQEEISAISSLADTGLSTIASRFQALSSHAKKRLEISKSRNPKPSKPLTLHDLRMAILYHKIDRKMQALEDRVVRQKEEFAMRGKAIADAVSVKYAKTRSRFHDMVESAMTPLLRPRVDKAMVVDRLETARGRAHRIVSQAARNLRGQHDRA